MAVNEDFLNFVVDQLATWGNVHPRKMFGGIGLYHEGKMFGLIGGNTNTFHLKADELNKEMYESRGMTRFMASETQKGLPYWEVPIDVLEDQEELASWAEEAYQAALRKPSKKKKSKS